MDSKRLQELRAEELAWIRSVVDAAPEKSMLAYSYLTMGCALATIDALALEAERLRAVVEAARELVIDGCPDCHYIPARLEAEVSALAGAEAENA